MARELCDGAAATQSGTPADTDQLPLKPVGAVHKKWPISNFRSWLAGIFLRFDAAQTLTAGQKTQARQNLGMGTAALADTGSAGGQVPVWAEGAENGYLVGDGTGVVGAVTGIPGQQILGTFIAQEDFRLAADLSPAQLTADQNDYNPTGLASASTVRLSSDASRQITGIAGGQDGRLLIIHNIGSNPIVLVDESASSAAANRLALAANVTLNADQSAVLQYDSTSSRWRLAAGPSAAGATADGYAVKTGNYTAVAGDRISADTNGGAFTVTLPASPSNGDSVWVKDARDTWGETASDKSITIGRNGNNIDGAASDLNLRVSGGSIQLVYNSTGGWRSFISTGRVNVQAFAINGTWVKPPNAQACDILLIGGGGGGASGRRGAPGTDRYGGGGGGGGATLRIRVPASALGATESITIGSGGTGGAAITTDDTNGATGVAGTATSIGTKYIAPGGIAGIGGTNASGTAGGARTHIVDFGSVSTGGGGAGTVTTGTGATSPGVIVPTGGAGGAGRPTSDGTFNGGNGGGYTSSGTSVIHTSITGAAAGTGGSVNGANGSTHHGLFGGGGGSGAAQATPGNGGNAGNYGGGGGGGAGGPNGVNSGAGGNGAPGFAVIITYCAK